MRAAALIAFTMGVSIGGDGGIRQRPVYVDAGECLARGVDGKLFVARNGEPCVALQPPPPPRKSSTVPRHSAKAFSELRRRMPEPGDFCGNP